MAVFGEHLRRERESRNVSLDQIAEATKISKRQLKALEDEQFQMLPGGIFNKGYVRAYSRFLGLNEDVMVAEYLEASGQSNKDDHAAEPQPATQDFRSRWQPAMSLALLAAVVLLAIGGAAAEGWHLYSAHKRRVISAGQKVSASLAPTHPAPITAAPAPVENAVKLEPVDREARHAAPRSETRNKTAVAAPATGQAAAMTPPPTSTGDTAPIELTVRAKDPAWVSIRSDGKVAMHGLLKPPEVKTVHASNQVVFWTGHAGDVEVSFNGKNVPLTGSPSDERVLVFNTRGLLPRSSP